MATYHKYQRLEDIEQLSDEDKYHIFYTIDNLIKAAKLKILLFADSK